ncbi:hypothetical protein AVEN_162941-1 [Araneus ventricosus]|uniref:Uncharacterized protein n=1 Tax=Araneus ventricosus TaxID=182803 RepID=A0A4Y2C082_ARAVE|nr:hypothetical protein AVEN_162941-1 [Araneus ventricosus]
MPKRKKQAFNLSRLVTMRKKQSRKKQAEEKNRISVNWTEYIKLLDERMKPLKKLNGDVLRTDFEQLQDEITRVLKKLNSDILTTDYGQVQDEIT